MAAPTRTPRDSWIEEGLRALGVGGPDAVRVEHRGALLDEMLDAWERIGVDAVIERVDGGGGDARAKLRRLFGLSSSSDELLEIELAIRDWARRDRAVGRRLRRVDNRRMDYLRSLFGAFCPDDDEVEARCVLAFSLWIGKHFIAADDGPRMRRLALERLQQ
jgi:hypothetical protein